MKILFTGGGGQVADAFRDALTSRKKFEAVFATKEMLDISDGEAVRDFLVQNQFDVIINAAAYTNVDGAETNHKLAFAVNHEGPMNLAAEAKKTSTRLIHISTDYVFSGDRSSPYTEGMELRPRGVYGRSKAAGEAPVLRYDYGLVIRTSWLYSFSGKNFIRTMVDLSSRKEEISVVEDQVGCPTSAWSLSYAILNILPQLEDKITWGPQRDRHSRIFHYRDAGIASWYDLACAIQLYFKYDKLSSQHNVDCRIAPIQTSDYIKNMKKQALEQGKQAPVIAPRPAYSVLSTEKIKKVFGLRINHWQNELAKILECGPEMLRY